MWLLVGDVCERDVTKRPPSDFSERMETKDGPGGLASSHGKFSWQVHLGWFALFV